MKKPFCAFFRVFLSVVLVSVPGYFPLSAIEAQERENLAVFEFTGRSISAMDASAVSDFVRTGFVNTGKFNVIDRGNMEKLLNEQKFQLTGCTSEECAVKMGKLLNVRKVIVGTVIKLGEAYYINANMVDVETGKIIDSRKVKSDAIESLADRAEDLAKLFAGMEVAESFEQAQAPAQADEQDAWGVSGTASRLKGGEAAPAAAPSKPRVKGNGYFDFFLGGKGSGTMNLTFDNPSYPIDETDVGIDFSGNGTLSSSIYYDTIEFTEMEAEMSAPIGIRVVGFSKLIGGGLEFSYFSGTMKKQTANVMYDSRYNDTIRFTVDDYISFKSYALLSGDIFFRLSSRAFQPYIGLGLGMTLNSVRSDYISQYHGAVYQRPLNNFGIGLLVRVPIGVRLKMGESFVMCIESRQTTNTIYFDRGILYEDDSLSCTARNILISMGASL